jgi:acetyl-CoA acetyltransferase family protein
MHADSDIVILAGARTPFGNFGGALAELTATDLGVIAASAAIERSGISRDDVDDVIFGNVVQTSADAAYLARHVGLRAGLPAKTPALTVNRLCGSGLQAILSAAHSLLLGSARYALAGGTESMSQAPHVVRGARKGFRFGADVRLEDSLWEALTDSYNGMPMAITAENLASRYSVTREESDAFALQSQERAVAAQASGFFAEEIVAVELAGPKGESLAIDRDEGPRPGLTRERLTQLPARFKSGGVVTAGNASGIADGAAAVVLTTAGRARADGRSWIGRLVSASVVGVDPDVMGIGPAHAIPRALREAQIQTKDVNVLEINEAFAPQVLACARELECDAHAESFNPHGGAISLGHPLGASGARLALTTLHALRARGGGYGVASACIGGGMGIAAVFAVE